MRLWAAAGISEERAGPGLRSHRQYNCPVPQPEGDSVRDELSALLLLPEDAKSARGLTHTPREIRQQPETWLGTFQRLQSMRPAIARALSECGIASGSRTQTDVILTGAGTSDYIGKALQSLLQTQWGSNVSSVASTDLLTSLSQAVLPGKQYLLISFSRSGESSEGMGVLSLALERFPQQVRHVVITCNEEGRMARMPSVFPIVLDDAVNDRGLAMTSSFTNMLIAGQYLAFLGGASGSFEPILQTQVALGRSLLAPAANLSAQLAKEGYSRVCFLGTGALHATAQECALKVLELNAGRITTLAESFLGLRHGPMSFLNEQTLVCAFISSDKARRRYELDLLEEIRDKRLAKDLVVLSPLPAAEIRHLTAHVLELEAPTEFDDDCRPPVDVMLGQLLGLFLSIQNGIQPDTPSTGAISRVVSHVRIYPPESPE